MNVVYYLIGTKPVRKVKIRLYHNKLSLITSTDLICETENWDFESGRFKDNGSLNDKLSKLKTEVLNSFNLDFNSGVVIDNEWLQETTKEIIGRPTTEKKLVNPTYAVFLEEFANYWIENHADTWQDSNDNFMTHKAKTQKTKALEEFVEFQTKEGLKAKKQNYKIRLKDFNLERINRFYAFLIGKGFAHSTSKKTITYIIFFCQRANEMKFNVCLDFKEKIVFRDRSTKVEDIYLNEAEIEAIFKHDFSDNEHLDIIRDNFILSLWTGKRISDLRNLTASNLINGRIESIDIKTQTLVKLPVFSQTKAILDKRQGFLPPKVGKNEYNVQIKEVCRLCGIDGMTLGKVKENGRKVLAYYEKYKLVTSHTARRSFATNLSRYFTVKEIAVLGGWKSPRMVEHYIKETKEEVADRVLKTIEHINI